MDSYSINFTYFMERLKKRTYQNIPANTYFWRTWDRQEIDLVEERGGQLYGYEYKWQHKRAKPKKKGEGQIPGGLF